VRSKRQDSSVVCGVTGRRWADRVRPSALGNALDEEQTKNYVLDMSSPDPHTATACGQRLHPMARDNREAFGGRMIRIVIEEAMALVSIALFVAMIAAWAGLLSSAW
jgi:hypothetical protein